MSCIASNPTFDRFLELTNNDVRKSTEYLAIAESPEFKQWYNDTTGNSFDSSIIDKNTVNAIIAFKNRENINTGDYLQNIVTSRTGVFGNDIAKEDHAINILSGIYLKSQGAIRSKLAEKKRKNDSTGITDSKGNNISPELAVKQVMVKYLMVFSKENADKLTNDQKDYLNTIIRNLYDNGKYGNNELFDLVVNSPEVISLSREFGINSNEDIDNEEDAVEDSEQDIFSSDQESIASLKADWSEIGDQRKDIDKNISKEVKEWFSKLPKTIDNTFINDKPNVANNTFSGIPETVDFATSFRAINSYGNFASVEAMVESFSSIASRFKEMSYLENAARILQDPKNVQIRNKIFSQMKQSIWVRNENSTTAEGSSVITKNRNTFPKLNIQNKILNSFDSLVINPVILSGDIPVLNNLKNRIVNLNQLSEEEKNNEIENIAEEIAGLINKYNIGINRQGVINYVRDSSSNKAHNLNALVDDLLTFNNNIAKASEILAIDNAAERKYYTEEFTKTLSDPNYTVKPYDKSLRMYKGGYGNNIANALSEKFKDYQLVQSEFNSMNAENNLVSDILKNNYISRLFNDRINDNRYNDNPQANTELRDYFVQFLNVPAYKYSNILLEKKLSNGVVIPGFIRQTEDGYELTEYYREFGMSLYNGVNNAITGKSKSYKNLNALEWDIVTLQQYANNSSTYEMLPGIRKANYFTQTPSDAPKTFVFNSYRFDIRGLKNAQGQYNRAHPIYISVANTYAKELSAMAQAIDYLFETKVENGVVTIVRDTNGHPKVKDEFKDLRKSNAKLNYHYRKSILDANGNPTGNVFRFRNLLIDELSNPSDLNYAAKVDMNYLFGDKGLFSLLYGGRNQDIMLVQESDGSYNIKLSGELRNSVYNYIDNYISYRAEEAISKYENLKQFVDRYKNASQQEFNNFITEMALNYEIQYNNMNDVLFGDEAYYKNAQDTIKRNKEYQAGGLSYAGFENYNVQKHITDIVIPTKDTPISVDTNFRYITLEDVMSNGATAADLKKQLKAAGVSKEVMEFSLGQFAKDKSEITDAQSFITLDEFVRRMYLRGEYDNYKDLIEALYDESKPVDNVKLGELAKKIQVQKNFYYDLEYDNDTKLMNPIQIKNAEYVLIPRFLGNTELGALAKLMQEHNIGQVNFTTTEKATTSKVLKFWDTYGSFPRKDSLSTFISDLDTHYKVGWYSNLYTQQDVPQHMDGENKAGLQIVKKLLDNIDGTPEGLQYIHDFFDCFTANIQESFNEAAERIGVKIDGKGNVVYDDYGAVIDVNKFIDVIKDELTRRGLDSNYRKYAEINPETGLPYMPAWTNLVRSKLENIVNSIFTNKITRQTLKGFHASQVSGIGMTPLSDRTDLRNLMQSKVEAKHGYSLGRKLKYHEDGSQIVEIMLPKWMVKSYNQYDAEGNLVKEITLEDLQNTGLDMMIGYRIPTEGKQSVAIMKVVGLLDESQGSTIVVPDEWVLQTGADYDIDSIYGIYYNASFDKEGKPHKVEYIDGTDEEAVTKRYNNYLYSHLSREAIQDAKDIAMELKQESGVSYKEAYDSAIAKFTKQEALYSRDEFTILPVARQNTREARDNKILETFINIMNLQVAVGENLATSNFKDIKDAKARIFPNLSNTFRNINSIVAQNWYRDANMSGARLKAISVNRDNFCSISNRAKTVIDSAYGGFKFIYDYNTEEEAKKAEAKLRLRFGNNSVSRDENRILINHNKLGWSYDNLNIENRLITPYSSETTALILDGVKEGGVPNVDLYTFDVYKSIVDCGASYDTSILFINQPVITELINMVNGNENIFGQEGYNPLLLLKQDLYRMFLVKAGRSKTEVAKIKKSKDLYSEILKIDPAFNEKALLANGISINGLRKHLSDNLLNGDLDVIGYQLQILNAFEHFKSIGDQINANMMVITSDKFGAGKSVNEIDNVIKRIQTLKDNNITRSEKGEPTLKIDNFDTPYSTLIDAVYPKIDFNSINEINEDYRESVYPSLYYQLKYSCIATEKIIRQTEIFKTQTPQFRSLVNAFRLKNMKSIQQAESFLINLSQAQSKFVNTNRFITVSNNLYIPSYNLNLISSQEDNRARLYGYTDVVGSFNISDLSEKNVEAFMKLSPANKVVLMQRYTTDNNLFKNLNVEYKGRRNSHDRISIVDGTISSESNYQMFRNAWNNDNPFVKLTAMDLVRYAITVEGYKFKGGTISKIIPVELLYTEDNGIDNESGVSTGTGIITDSDKAINSMTQLSIGAEVVINEAAIEELKDLFFRTNPNNPDVYTFENKRYGEENKLVPDLLGVLRMSFGAAYARRIITGRDENFEVKNYVKTNIGNTVNMYKVSTDSGDVVLLPVNPLEENEIAHISVNPENNCRFLPLKSLERTVISRIEPSVISSVYSSLRGNMRRFMIIPILGDAHRITEVFDNVQAISSPIEEQQIDTSKRYLLNITDKAQLNLMIQRLENAGVNNYIVVVPNANYKDVRSAINQYNTVDLDNRKAQLAQQKFETNEVQIRKKKSDNSELPQYTQLKNSINSTLTDVDVNGIGFVPVLQAIVDNTGFRSGGYFRYNKEGKNYIVTNLGRVSSKSMSLTQDFLYSETRVVNGVSKLVFPRREALQRVVKKNEMLDKFVNNNMLRVQTEENFQNENVLESAIVDNDREINDYISRVIESVERANANIEEDGLTDAFRSFNALDLRTNTATKLNDNLREQALRVINSYTDRRIDDFLFGINNFFTVYETDANGEIVIRPDGQQSVIEKWGITNKKLFDRMLTDEVLRNRYEMFLDDINRFIEEFSIIESIQPYNIEEAIATAETEDEVNALRRTNDILTQIKNKFKRIKDLDSLVKRSTKMYFDTYITSLTKDPRIQSELMRVTDAFEDENYTQFWLADSQETHVPIVQIVLKKMMAQIRASEIDARDTKINFVEKVSKIIEDAKNNGKIVSMDDILDEDGNLLLPYTTEFLDKIRELKENLKIAQIEDPDGRNGLIYKKAKDELERFLIDNVEREYKKEMYEDYYKLNQILNKYPKTYTKLMKLMQEEGEILSTMVDNDYATLTPQNARRLRQIQDEIADMRSVIDEDGEYKENYRECNAVNNYFLRRRELNNKYKIRVPKEAFLERFKQAKDSLQYPEDSDTYKEGLEWLKANTDFSLMDSFNQEMRKAYKDSRYGDPFNSYFRSIARGKYDENGVVNGTLFTAEQVANIKKNVETLNEASKARPVPNEEEANKWLNEHVEIVTTKYYQEEYVRMNNSGKEAFDKWYKENHTINPTTGEYEALPIWKQRIIKNEEKYMEYTPKYKWLKTEVKEEYKVNPNYTHVLTPSSDKYKNHKYYALNSYQMQLRDTVTDLLDKLVKDKRSRTYINKGYLPNQAVAKPHEGFSDYWQDFKRSHGWYDTPNKSDIELNLYKRFSNAPMLHSLSDIKLLPLRERTEGESAEEYIAYVRETQAKNNELRKQRREENKARNNPNVMERLTAFIDSMYNFNTRNDIARLAKITSSQLRNSQIVRKSSNNSLLTNNLLSRITGKEQIRTTQSEDSKIVQHFENQVRKLVFNEFELDQGTLSKTSRVLRNMVSSKFMMLNLTGGIANVLYGKTQIQMEMAAREFFRYGDFRKGENEWMQAIGSYIADAYKETTNNETNAIIRLFNVIDSDMVTERYGQGKFGRLEELLFIQQSAGEHYMQNATLLAMLQSHRLVEHNGKMEVMSFDQYSINQREKSLLKVLEAHDPALVTRYNNFKAKIGESYANKEKYIRFKADIITDFLKSMPMDIRKEFKETYKTDSKAEREVFESLPTFRSQFELKNGVAVLKSDSVLTNTDVAAFRNKVIAVNHQIHGIYDKIGANIMQQNWAGALLMQFHKHLVPGFQKRFGYRLGHFDGIYNETRESISKGTYVSLGEFITMPFRKYYELNNSNELQAVETLQGIAKNYMNFVANLGTYYSILPEYDKANIRRCLSEWIGIIKAIALFVAGKLLLDEDDESTQAADYILYSADRLMSETIQFTPWGIINEGQKLYSQPSAALSIALDGAKILEACCAYMVTGESDDLYYQSGSMAGENKITSNIIRNIPLWNQIGKYERLGTNNRYYKVRSNPFSGFGQIVANAIGGDEE